MWSAIAHTIEITEVSTEDLRKRRDRFLQDLACLFEEIEKRFENLPEGYREKCGRSGIAADISLKVDMGKREIILNRLYKYCEMDVHLFRNLIRILQQNFPEYSLVVPSLEGFQLAEEISKHLAGAFIECLYLKGEDDERLLMGDCLKEVRLEDILDDTRQHYAETGGIEMKEATTRCGGEISMFRRGEEGDEEILWMQLRAPICPFTATAVKPSDSKKI
ncbi:MAG: hypothetical protein HPY61_12630 [Methanotrichaceae archaeon]|nr:hypothetical protein [Methanotrichaceae archaeon]